MQSNDHVRVNFNKIPHIEKMMPRDLDKALRMIAEEGVNIAKASMLESPASGRKYPRGKKVHIASSPGNPPRPDIGNLLNATGWETRGAGQVAICFRTDYAAGLEYGTTKTAPRPFAGPMRQTLEAETIPMVFDSFLEDA